MEKKFTWSTEVFAALQSDEHGFGFCYQFSHDRAVIHIFAVQISGMI